MASFSFDFLPKEKEEKRTTEISSAADETKTFSAAGQRKRPPFVWLTELRKLLEERCRKEIVYSEIPIAVSYETPCYEVQNVDTSLQVESSMSPICCVDLESSSFLTKPPLTAGNESLQHQEQPTWKQTDMQPSVYEGGMKVWECSLDLLRYLAEEKYPSILFHDDGHPPQAVSVLELGCGHALPSCFLLREALRLSSPQEPIISFVLSDYNDFVVQDATLSNLVLNTAQVTAPQPEDRAKRIQRHVRVGYGDWMDMSRQLKQQQANESNDGYFDLILAAETIYSDQTAQETAQLLARNLRPHTGVALVATKRYYFGVGGGSDALRRYIMEQQQHDKVCHYYLEVETVREYDNGSGNIRELLRVTHCGSKR